MDSAIDEARVSATEQNMIAQGAELTEKQAPVDYWGADVVHRHYMPDKIQYVEFREMNEGMRRRYQKETASSMEYVKSSGNTKMQVDPGKERLVLLRTCCVGWNMYRGGNPVRWSMRSFEEWLDCANPKLVDDLDKAVREANPWMQSNMSVEDIDIEIERLQELREEAVQREKEEAEFPSR